MGKDKGPSPPPPINPSKEFSKILDVFQNKELPAYQQFSANEPLLSGANRLAMNVAGQLPSLTQALQSGYGSAVNAYRQTVNPQLLQTALQNAYRGAVPTQQLTSPLLQTLQGQINPILQSGGALTPQLQRQATQEAAARNAAAGMATTTPGLFAEALNRDVYRQQRYNTALQQALGVTQGISGLDTAALQRALGYTQGAEGISQANLQQALQRFGLGLSYGQGLQGLNIGALQGLIGAEQAQTGAFSGLLGLPANVTTNAIEFNRNAEAAANIAGANQKAGTTSGLLGLGGSIAIAV